MTAAQNIFAILDTMTVELPPETPEAAERMAKQNEELSQSEELRGLGIRVYRGGTDYGFRTYDTLMTNMSYSALQKMKRRPEAQRLESGMLVKVFNTVSDGDVCWQGKIDFDTKEYHHGLQKGMDGKTWARMFYDGMPAKLVQDGRTIYGRLEPFCETGTEGVIWSLHEYGVQSYAGLHCLRDGDDLTVYSAVRDGNVAWQGVLDFGPEQVTKINWTEVLRTAKHMDTEKWLHMCYDQCPVVITPAPKGP
jgi:hypothetical protein